MIVPSAVVAELTHERTPALVRTWIASKPIWLDVQAPKAAATANDISLGAGELAAIELAEELSADALLIDDRDGRREAERRGLPVLGTLRVLADAAAQELIDLEPAFERLAQTNFRTDPGLLQQLLAIDRRRRGA